MRPFGRLGFALLAATVPAVAGAQDKAPNPKLSPPVQSRAAAAAARPQTDPAPQTDAPAPETPSTVEVEVIATGLNSPWAFAFLPDGDVLVTERQGTMRTINAEGVITAPIAGLPPVKAVADYGLHDVILDPNFVVNRLIYFTYFAPPADEPAGVWPDEVFDRWMALPLEERLAGDLGTERVARARLLENDRELAEVEVLADGGDRRLAFAPDGALYVTGADRFRLYESDLDGPDQAIADLRTLATYTGRVVRITRNGYLPTDNPWTDDDGVPDDTFSYGYRDLRGAAIHPETSELWVADQGALGGDELNIVRGGGDYGWPNDSHGRRLEGAVPVTSKRERVGVVQPIYTWGVSIAPSGMLFYTGDLFPDWQGDLLVGATSAADGGFLARLELDGERVVEEERLLNGHNEGVQDVRQAPDGSVWVLGAEGSLLRLTPGLLGAAEVLHAEAEPVLAAAAAPAAPPPAMSEADAPGPAAEVESVSLAETSAPDPASPSTPASEADPAPAPATAMDAGPIPVPSQADLVPLNAPPPTAAVHEDTLPPVTTITVIRGGKISTVPIAQ